MENRRYTLIYKGKHIVASFDGYGEAYEQMVKEFKELDCDLKEVSHIDYLIGKQKEKGWEDIIVEQSDEVQDGVKISPLVLLDVLHSKYKFYSNEKNSHRLKTIELAMDIVKKSENTAIFYDLELTKATISNFYNDLNEELVGDVANALNSTAKSIVSTHSISKVSRKYRREKRKQ